MKRIDPKKKKAPAVPVIPVKPSEDESTVARSGSGASTALQAMLRKRQMRAGRDEPPTEPAKKAANE
jgi:hypothetical protein